MIDRLPRREREIFEILCNVREASGPEIRAKLADPPSYSAVRTMLSRLEARAAVGVVVEGRAVTVATFREDLDLGRVDELTAGRSVPQPAKVRQTALNRFVQTFFEGSTASAATALLGMSKKLTVEEVEALQRAIDAAKERK